MMRGGGLADPKGIITQKKYFGVKSEFDRSEDVSYVLVTDSESIACKRCNLYDLVHARYVKKQIKANKSIYGGNIIRRICTVLRPHIDYDFIAAKTESFSLYWWMNDACIYSRSDFNEFYLWLRSLPAYQELIDDYWCFDYLLYTIYLVIYKGFEIIRVPDDRESYHYGAVEHSHEASLVYPYNSLIDAVYDSSDTSAVFKIHVDVFPAKYSVVNSRYTMLVGGSLGFLSRIFRKLRYSRGG